MKVNKERTQSKTKKFEAVEEQEGNKSEKFKKWRIARQLIKNSAKIEQLKKLNNAIQKPLRPSLKLVAFF